MSKMILMLALVMSLTGCATTGKFMAAAFSGWAPQNQNGGSRTISCQTSHYGSNSTTYCN